MTDRAHVGLPFIHLRERAVSALQHAEARLRSAARAVVTPKSPPLPHALEAEHKTMRTRHGSTLSFFADAHGDGRPLVLVHSVNACASAYEVRPLFEHYRGKRPVYAVELAGFGASSRDDRPYTPELYTDELVELLARVKDKEGKAADVVAMSLSCEFVARAAHARKDLVHTMAFLSPTGLDARRASRGTSTEDYGANGHGPRREPGAHWWAPIVFAAIASKPSIHYFLRRSFAGQVDAKLEEYAYAASHQEGAEYAPLAFLSGRLFTPGIYDTYADVERPVLAVYDKDAHARFDRLAELVRTNTRWSMKRVAPTKGMPHFERLDETASALDTFWESHPHDHS